MVNKDFLNVHFKVVDYYYGGCLGFAMFDENIDLCANIEGDPNTLFLSFCDGKIILNTHESDDGYREIEFG